MPSDSTRRSELTRRRVLALSGGVSATTLAGCFGEEPDVDDDPADGDPADDDPADDDPADDDPDEEDVYFTTGGMMPPNEIEWNPIAHNYSTWEHRAFRDRFAVYSPIEEDYLGQLATDWGLEGDDTVFLEIHDGYTWTNGDPLTAEDAETHFEMEKFMGFDIANFIESAEAVEDYRLEMYLLDDVVGVNEGILWNNVFWWENWLEYSNERFGEYVEQFRDADGDEDEIQSIQEDITEESWGHDELLGHSMWDIESASETRWVLAPREEYPHADEVNFKREILVDIDAEPALRSEDVNMVFGEADLEGLPDRYEPSYGFPPTFHGFGPGFGQGRDGDGPFLDPLVRKATAYIFDLERYYDLFSGPQNPRVEHQTGIFEPYMGEYLGDVLDDFEDYDTVDHDRAAELLERAGFSEENGTWYTGADEPWEPDIRIMDWFPEEGTELAHQFEDFGVDAEVITEEGGLWFDEVRENGTFDITIYGIGGTFGNHPWQDFNRNWTTSAGGSITNWGLDPEPEVPMPIGDPDGDPEPIDIEATMEELRMAESDSEEEHELVQLLAWTHNQTLPRLQVDNTSDYFWIDTQDWEWPDESNPWWEAHSGAEELLKMGEVSPR